MERPNSIVLFERCYLGSLAVGLVNTAVSWKGTQAQLAENPAAAQLGASFAQGMVVGGALLGIAISLLLWYFTARQGSVVTKWIITVFFALGVLGLVLGAVRGTMPQGVSGILVVIAWVLNAIAVWQLFKRDSKVWFGEETV